MITIGITGGIGSGKTTVANFFKTYNIPVYIADEEAKKLMLHSPIKEELIEEFGQESYTEEGELNRAFIADQVFDNKSRLKKLNSIVHPRVRKHFKKWVSQQSSPYVLYEAAILFETQKYQEFDYTILVTAPEKERIARVKKRDNSTEEEIKSRMKNQWPDSQKKQLADWTIENISLPKTKAKAHNLHMIISKL